MAQHLMSMVMPLRPGNALQHTLHDVGGYHASVSTNSALRETGRGQPMLWPYLLLHWQEQSASCNLRGPWPAQVRMPVSERGAG